MKNYPVELVKEYELAKLGCCPNCRQELNEDELVYQYDPRVWSEWNTCPECDSEIDELDKLTLDEYADSLIEKGFKIDDYENND